MMRQEYAISQEQLDTLLDACKPVRAMYLSGGALMGPTPQENANDAWRKLGEEVGFKWDTVNPIPGRGNREFTAEPLERLE